MDDTERARQGMTVRREVLGDEHVDRAVAATTPFTEPFQDFITRYAWGDIWSRPGLSRAERSLVTLSVLAAMYFPDEPGANAADPVLCSIGAPKRRATLVAVPEPEGQLRFDIFLQGERETVFFDA